jgi:opacity protein-like surface antigen
MSTITFRADPMGQATAESGKSANATRRKGRGIAAATGVALAASLFAASGAQAQNCTVTNSGLVSNTGQVGSAPAAIASMVGSSITAATTAFLLQSSSFIGSPPNPAPDQQGGGIWVRGVGGQVDIKSNSVSSVAITPAAGGAPLGTATVNCSQKVDTSFAGVQFGSDIAKLNVNGWNLHLGTTAGVLETRSNLVGGAFAFIDVTGLPAGGGPFTSTTQVPFFGVYGAATKGGFFIDGLLRQEYYQSSLNSPGDLLTGQALDAHGWSFSSSAGYNWAVPNSNWFIEPSGSIVISRTKVDPLAFTTAGTPGLTQLPGTLQLNEIKSDIGRIGLRVGETIDGGTVVWQPFAAVSVWHEFGPNLTGNYTSEPGCCVVGATFVNGTGAGSLSTIGTFGQYSLGISGAVAGTGWLGFARVDYRDGPNLQGLSGTAGIRYQFTPDVAVASHMPVKAPVLKAPVMTAVNWTGFYLGGFGGAALGRADWKYTGNVPGSASEASPHVGGFEGGGDIGYNWQRDRWVIGVEGSLEGLNARGGVACNPGVPVTGAPFPAVFLLTTCNASASWIATADARLGYTWERALFYVKGGGAWTNEHFSTNCNNGPTSIFGLNCTNQMGVTTTGATASAGRGGWTIGTGTEFALTRAWSAVAESDYVSFSDRNLTMSDGNVINAGLHFWETKVGLNYHFNAGPVAAKY